MNETLLDRERQRDVWRRARSDLGLVDVGSDGFGLGGLGARVPGLTTRILVQPADPEKVITEFDEELWQWWLKLQSSAGGRKIEWGHEHHATLTAMVRHDRASDDPWQWNRYVALHRTGALESGLGRVGGREWNGGRIFFLINIVGRAWACLLQYRAVLERLAPQGPWEVTLAMVKTQGSLLGNVGEGWAEPMNLSDYERLPCPEPNVLIRFEHPAWPQSDDEVKELAFLIGGRIEDSWGFTGRRFLARIGQREGQFDIAGLNG